MSISFFGTALADIILQNLSSKLEHESLFASKYHTAHPGGKAVNQAACASLFGAKTKILAKVGNDELGNLIKIELEKHNVSTECLLTDFALPTGFVVLTPENIDYKSVLVSYSASLKITDYELQKVEKEFFSSTFIVGGLELNLKLIKNILQKAKRKKKTIIIDPYPPEKADVEVLNYADIITPNREEGSIITGRDIKSIYAAKMAVTELLKMGIKTVCLKLGADGLVIGRKNEIHHIPPVKVQAVDTTGGGDIFAGVLTALLEKKVDLFTSAKIANYASALGVTRLGAFSSIPRPNEVYEFMLHRGAEDSLLKTMEHLLRLP